MVVQIRLEIPVEYNGSTVDSQAKANAKVRTIAKEMGIAVSRVKVREDVVHLYGTKVSE